MGSHRTSAKRRRLDIELKNSPPQQRSRRIRQPHEDDEEDDNNYFEDEGDLNVVDQAISILLISKEIFDQLSDEDLLNCSLVNKTWNASARFTLREDRKCYAYISGHKQCKKLIRLRHDMRNAWNIPFNGLSFSNNTYDYEDPFSSSDSDTPGRIDVNVDDAGGKDEHRCIVTSKDYDVVTLYEPLLTFMKIKYLRVHWEKEPKLNCPASKFIFHLANCNKFKSNNNNNSNNNINIVALTVDALPSTAKNVSKYFGFNFNPAPSTSTKLSKDSKERASGPKDVEPNTVSSNSASANNESNEFPTVRVLELPKQRWSWSLDCNPISIVKDLLTAIPKLELLVGYISLEFLPAILQLKKSYAVQEFSLELQKFRYKHLEILGTSGNNGNNEDYEDHEISKLLDYALAFAKEKPKIRKLVISTSCSPLILFHTEGIFECKTKALMISRMILESSSEVLRELCINHLDLVALAEKFTSITTASITTRTTPRSGDVPGGGLLGICTSPIRLIRLTHITVECHEEIDALLAFSLLSRVNFDYTSIFPRLESIQINCKRFGYFIERDAIHPYMMENFRQLRMNHCFESVSKLHINGEFKGSNAKTVICDFAKLFPNVKTFISNMYECEKLEECCEALWTAWPELEFLRFQGVQDVLVKTNLDPCFTGLSRQDCNNFLASKKWGEVDEFQKLQDGRSSLLNLTKLKLLQVEIHHFKNCEKSKTRSRVFLSELTGRYVFDRMPQLAIEVQRYTCESGDELVEETKCCFELEHLRPYVEFVHNLPYMPYLD